MESYSDNEELDTPPTTQEKNILSANTGFDEEDFDDVFTDNPPNVDMESPTGINTPFRRVSDVIDSIGDLSISPSHTQRNSSSSASEEMVSSAVSQATNISELNRSRRAELTTESIDLGYSSPGAPSSSQPYRENWFRYSTNNDADLVDAQPMQGRETQKTSVNTGNMPVVKDDHVYNMNHEYRGVAVIINHEIFDDMNVSDRNGSMKDVEDLKTMFYRLDFAVVVWNNLSQAKLWKNLDDLALQDHSNNDCLAVVVLTHGLGSSYIYAKDSPYSVEKLWTTFTPDKCPTLAGKPKLFFIQACRGEKLDSGFLLSRESNTEVDSFAAAYKIPTYADFLITFSTYQGHYSFRHPTNGTWFIQSLCVEVNKHNLSSIDFLGVMTRVSRRVALTYESFIPEKSWMNQQKQIPTIHSMLIRDLYFKPKNKPPPEPKLLE